VVDTDVAADGLPAHVCFILRVGGGGLVKPEDLHGLGRVRLAARHPWRVVIPVVVVEGVLDRHVPAGALQRSVFDVNRDFSRAVRGRCRRLTVGGRGAVARGQRQSDGEGKAAGAARRVRDPMVTSRASPKC
jgi:hypothetical protein